MKALDLSPDRWFTSLLDLRGSHTTKLESIM